MVMPRAFDRELKLATAGLEPQAINTLLAQAARQALAEAQSDGSAPANYTIAVNGRIGAPEESVKAPGPIVYSFNWFPEVVTYGLAFAEARSPVLSGRFKRSWFALVNGEPVTDLESIPLDGEVVITNDQPYSRKVEIGHMRMSVPPGIVQDLRQALLRRFGDLLRVEVRFVSLAGGYVLHRNSGRKDRKAGRALTYPAAVITANL